MLFYTPDAAQLQTQSRRNNQGRSGDAVERALRRGAAALARRSGASRDAYEWMTGNEVARELARIDLPLSTYTQWYWKIDLHNLLHFLTLRVDAHAQWEIQEYGRVMAGMLKRVAPLSYEAWIDYDVCGAHLSRAELESCAPGQGRGGRPRRRRARRQSRGAGAARLPSARSTSCSPSWRPEPRCPTSSWTCRGPHRRALRRALRVGRPVRREADRIARQPGW